MSTTKLKPFSNSSFYNQFHKSPKIQKRIIRSNNFTYYLAIKILNTVLARKKKIRILDYGCGVGTLDFYLLSKGHHVTGVDISSKAIGLATKNAKYLSLKNGTFLTADEFDSRKKELFDLIVCLEVIEHVDEEVVLLNKLSLLLRPGGILLLSTPSESAPLHKLGLAKQFDKSVGHLRRYTDKSISEKLIGANFIVDDVIKTEGIFRNSLYVFRPLGILIKFFIGPIPNILMSIDSLFVRAFGESNIYVIARKR